MTDTMLQQINEAIFKRIHHLVSKVTVSVITNVQQKYDDIEVTEQTQLTKLCFDYSDKTYTLNMGKLDEEEYKNIDAITTELQVQYEFLQRLDAITYPDIVTSRSQQLGALISSLDYYKSAFQFVLDQANKKKEESTAKSAKVSFRMFDVVAKHIEEKKPLKWVIVDDTCIDYTDNHLKVSILSSKDALVVVIMLDDNPSKRFHLDTWNDVFDYINTPAIKYYDSIIKNFFTDVLHSQGIE